MHRSLVVFTFALLSAAHAAEPPANAKGFSGKVIGPDGKGVAGAWVTAIAESPATEPRVTVATDETGAFRSGVLPGKGPYRARIRRYGFQDRWIRGLDGKSPIEVRFEEGDRLSRKESAQQLPGAYWISLFEAPPSSTLKQAKKSEKEWWGLFRQSCTHCHASATPLMRWPRSQEEWRRMYHLNPKMEWYVSKWLGEEPFLAAMENWSKRIAKGDLPSDEPDLPRADHRWTEWRIANPYSWTRDIAVANKDDPSVRARAPKGASGSWVYAGDTGWGRIWGLNVDTGVERVWEIPYAPRKVRWNYKSWAIYPYNAAPVMAEVDSSGRLLMTADVSEDDPPGRYGDASHDLLVFDPSAEKFMPMPSICDPHTVVVDASKTIWGSGGIGELCSRPTSGPETLIKFPNLISTEAAYGATKDLSYGIALAPDGSVWTHLLFGNRLWRYDPPTKSFSKWETPEFGVRGMGFDSKGALWMNSATGALIRFDPRSEKFSVFRTPGPRHRRFGSVDSHFALIVDVKGAAGTKDAVYMSGNDTGSVIAFDPATERFKTYPNPHAGFYLKNLKLGYGAVWGVYGDDPAKFGETEPFAAAPDIRVMRLELAPPSAN